MISAENLFRPQPNLAGPDAPLDHLVACHRRIEERLGTFERAAALLESRRGEALEAFQAAFRFLDTSGVLHTADEEDSLFPRLRPLLPLEGVEYLERLERDHVEAEKTFFALKSAVGDAIAGAVSRPQIVTLVERLTTLYRLHIASEDDLLQTYARNHLTAADLAAVASEMKKRRRA